MTTEQILWSLNSFLLVVLFFFVKIWLSNLSRDLDKMEKRIDLKLDKLTCTERHSDMKSSCEKLRHHRHSPVTGALGGEVIML